MVEATKIQDEKFNKVVEIMDRAELDPRLQEHLRVFLFSLIDKPQFDLLVKLLDENPGIADKFWYCFELKTRFLEYGGTQDDWNHILEKEKEIITQAKDLKAPALG